MKVILTGSEGQVGKYLQLKLESRVELSDFSKNGLDITNEKKVNSFVRSIQPNIIINAAAYTAVDNAEDNRELAFKVNMDGPKYLATAAEKTGAAIIHISTDYVFDGDKDSPYFEIDAVNPKGVYGASKLAGENAVIDACNRHIILRTAWIFGSHGSNFVKTMLRLASEHKNLGIVNDQFGGPTFAGDLADSILSIIEKIGQGRQVDWGLYHYSGLPYTNWYEFASHIFTLARETGLLEKSPNLNPLSSSEYPTKALRPKNSRLNCDKIFSKFGVSPSHWQLALEHLIENSR